MVERKTGRSHNECSYTNEGEEEESEEEGSFFDSDSDEEGDKESDGGHMHSRSSNTIKLGAAMARTLSASIPGKEFQQVDTNSSYLSLTLQSGLLQIDNFISEVSKLYLIVVLTLLF